MSRTALIWVALAVAVTVPVALAATSPYLAWRSPVYIAAGFAGIIAMGLLLVQPLLAGNYLPGLSPRGARHVHAWVGIALVTAIVVHVAGLWLTSAPDVIDALLFRSPTPFSVWGVIAMWAVFATACIAATRRALRLSPRTWRRIHLALATIIIPGSVIHAMLIEGTMELVSKTILCAIAVICFAILLADPKSLKFRTRRRG